MKPKVLVSDDDFNYERYIILFSLGKSLDEVMYIGRSFETAFQQTLRIIDEDVIGFDPYSRTITDDVRLIKDYLEFLLYFFIPR